jgi:hypothetical protein
VAALLAAAASDLPAADWVRAGLNTNQPVWGLVGGLQFAMHPGGFRGRDGGPRGLLRLGYPVLTNEGYDLINFIAIEPIVQGRRGFSELEHSRLDNAPGKRFWADAPTNAPGPGTVLSPGRISQPAPGRELLEVVLRVEKFDNGAHVYLVISQRADQPDEIRFSLHAAADSAPLEYCILTATMGNLARTRQLWLKDEVLSSLKLYPHYRDTGFVDHTIVSLDRLLATSAKEIVAAITTDEAEPAAVRPFPGTRHWYYGGDQVTQYWKKPANSYRPDLQVAVNARYTYWLSRQPIPGGIAFENFEMRERFFDGQHFVFGITRRTPLEMGFKPGVESVPPGK